MDKVLVLLSGGLDSSTLACYLAKNEKRQIQGLFINYGQSMANTERRCAEAIGDWAGIDVHSIDLPLDHSLVNGCLFSSKVEAWESHFISYLPQRNLFLLTVAAMFAQNNKISEIYIGAIKINNIPFPDTTPDFFISAQESLRCSHPSLTICYPFINKDKGEIVSLANKIGLPIDATFSCEMATDHHCMQCPSCLDRYWAMKK